MRGLFGAAAALVVMASQSSKAESGATSDRSATASIGTATINIYGRLRGIVLVDPLGRKDVLTDSTQVTDIPGCSRWPGGIEHDLDDPDTTSEDLMLFELDVIVPGKYKIAAIADDSADVRINVVFEPSNGIGVGCPSVERAEGVPAGPVSWALEALSDPPKDDCHLRIGAAVVGKRKGDR